MLNILILVQFPRDGGIVPVSWFSYAFNCVNAVHEPKTSGIVPVNWLPGRENPRIFVQAPKDAGTVPENWLNPNTKFVRSVAEEKNSGTVPFNWLFATWNTLNVDERSSIWVGIDPIKLLPAVDVYLFFVQPSCIRDGTKIRIGIPESRNETG